MNVQPVEMIHARKMPMCCTEHQHACPGIAVSLDGSAVDLMHSVSVSTASYRYTTATVTGVVHLQCICPRLS